MKLFFLLTLIFAFSSNEVFAQNRRRKQPAPLPTLNTSVVVDNSLAQSFKPTNYLKRSDPTLNVALVYYGDYYTEDDLSRVQKMLEERFHLATNKLLTLNTVLKRVVPFKFQVADYPDYAQEFVTDMERLQRLWYYDNVGPLVLKEVWEQMKNQLEKVDMLLIITGAQINSNAYASGRIAMVENPVEIAWALPDGGRVEYLSDESVVDKLMHELGHTMFLDHASNKCFHQPGQTYRDSLACCAESPNRHDLMSYCRNQPPIKKASEEKFSKFGDCMIGIIKEKFIPALLNGGSRFLKNRPQCL